MRRSPRSSVVARALAAALALAPIAPSGTALAQPRVPAPPAGPKLTKEPKPTTFVSADFPESERARTDRSPVTVVLRLDISERGDVTGAEVTTSAGAAFAAAALAAARKFVFEPAEIDGKPGKIRILYRYVFTFPEEAPKTATFRGTVRSRSGNAPLAKVTVTLDDGRSAETDATGRFAFEGLAPGAHTVTLSGDRLTQVRTEETLTAGKALEATYDVELAPEKGATAPSDDLEIVVTAPALEKRVVSTEIKADEGRRLPGTQGDVLKVVESMPGVARASAGSGQLVVWGASPEETRVYVDGVRVPRLYHDGGLRSIVATELVDAVELSPGAYGSAYGRGLGGIVLVRTKRWDESRPRASLGVDLYDASGSLRVPLTKELRVEIAGRRSHVDSILSAFAKDDVGDFFPAPRYADGQVRLSYSPSDREHASLTLLGSSDRTERTVKSSDPLLTRSEEKGTSFFRLYGKYERDLDDGGKVSVVPSFGRDLQTRSIALGDTRAELRNASTVYATRASYRKKLHPNVTLTTGVDAELTSSTLSRDGSVTSPPREGDARVFGQPPQDRRNGDTWSVTQLGLAPFGELDVALFDERVHVVPGLRFDPTFVSVSRVTPVEGDTPALGAFREDAAIEPRLAASVAASSRITFKAAYARVRQPALAEDLSAVFGNPLLPTASGHHVLAGTSARLFPSTTLEATVFWISQDELAARSTSPTPRLAEALEPIGSGRAYGMQAMLRRELAKGFMGWVSYSLVRSERRDAPGLGYRPSDYDQSHVLTALGSYDLGHGFEVGARVRFATGFPRTAVAYALPDTRSDRFEPVFGPKNRERLPAFFQVDLRISKRFALPAGELETYLEVLNVTNQQNAEELVYTRDYRTKGVLTGLPILPLFGLRWNL